MTYFDHDCRDIVLYARKPKELIPHPYYLANIPVQDQAQGTKLEPYWIARFSAGDGGFSISLYQSSRARLGYEITFKFVVSQRSIDNLVINKLLDYFKGLGFSQDRDRDNCSTFVVSSTVTLWNIIVPFFLSYPLNTVKQFDLYLFYQVLSLMPLNSAEKVEQIKLILTCMNKHKHHLTNMPALHPWWVTGFINAEGCFLISFYKKKNYRLGIKVVPRLLITQHGENALVFEALKEFFGCGRIYKGDTGFEIEGFKSITEVVIPHFLAYPLQSIKRDDFSHFVRIVDIIREKKHLTKEGLESIRKIKSIMNRGRPIDTVKDN